MREHTVTTIRQLLEGSPDRRARRLEREAGVLHNQADDPEPRKLTNPTAFLSSIKAKLRRKPNLGQLDLKAWRELIANAKAKDYYIYVAIPYDYAGSLNYLMLLQLTDVVKEHGADYIHVKSTNLVSPRATKWTIGAGWSINSYSRPELNNLMGDTTHMFILPDLSPQGVDKKVNFRSLYPDVEAT